MLGSNCRNVLLRVPAIRRAISTSFPSCNPIVVRMPALSPTMTEGTIVSWVKKEGDEISAGDGLCEIQTDKAVMTMEIEEDGVLAKILKRESGNAVTVGEAIAVIAEDGEDWQSVEAPESEESSASPPPSAVIEAHRRESRDAEFPPLRDLATLRIGPAVRLLLELYRLHPHDIEIVGPHHRLLKGDVLAYIAERGLKPQPPEASAPPSVASTPKASVVKSPLPHQLPAAPSELPTMATMPPVDNIAFKDIVPTSPEASAAHMSSLSKRAVPHNYVSLDVTLDHMIEVAERAKLPVGPFILKAAAVALNAVPAANSFLNADGVVVEHPVIDIAVISTIHRNSAPCVIRSVDRMTCGDIAQKLQNANPSPGDASSATFTVIDLTDSNVAHLAAIVSPPQAAVLALGGISSTFMPISGIPKSVQKITATLSVDTRVLDQTEAAQFLSAFSSAVEMAMVAVPAASTASSFSPRDFDDLLGLGLD